MHQIKLEKAKVIETHPVALPSVCPTTAPSSMVAPEVEATGATGATGAKPRPQAPEFIFLCKTGWLRDREEGGEAGGADGGEGSWEDRSWCCAIEAPVRAPARGGRQTAKR